VTWDLFSAAEAARREAESMAEPAATLQGQPGEWTVSALNAAARGVVESAFPAAWVVGEVTNFTRARSGHCYFTLRDDAAQIRCVMWRDDARRLPTTPEEGMEIRAFGRLTIYPARGDFQLSVSHLEGRGEGLWKLAFERLRAELHAEGLLDPDRKRPLPRFPARVGVVTSPDGAALRDIATVIRRRAPWTDIILIGCRVQGEGAAAEIAAAIRQAARAGCADVLIVGRGGGSVEDLWAFNEEPVARAISECPIPVVSAVGHETDFTIADLVADLRAPTPSAAAEACVPDAAALRRELGVMRQRMAATAAARLQRSRDVVGVLREDLLVSGLHSIRTRRDGLSALAGQLHALSPLGALARGFAVPLGGNGRLLRSVGELRAGAGFTLRMGDGVADCRVERTGPLPPGGIS
jgi:exodeoxyribonuclease VII large subunit